MSMVAVFLLLQIGVRIEATCWIVIESLEIWMKWAANLLETNF